MNTQYTLDVVYLVASVTFVIGLKMLSHPDSARKGNLVAAFGMALAIAATIFLPKSEIHPLIYGLIGGAILIGTVWDGSPQKK
jgi:H+-translocating NAD(P) transhydrogenase subunit beta